MYLLEIRGYYSVPFLPAAPVTFNCSSSVKGRVRGGKLEFWVLRKLPGPFFHNVIIQANLGQGYRVVGNIGLPRKEKIHYGSFWTGNRR